MRDFAVEITSRIQELNERSSRAYRDIIFNILARGSQERFEDKFITNRQYALNIKGDRYGLVFSLYLNVNGGNGIYGMPAVQNSVYTLDRARQFKLPTGTTVSRELIQEYSIELNALTSKYSIGDLYEFICEFPDRILDYMNGITEYLNSCGGVPIGFEEYARTGRFVFGPVAIFPQIQDNGISYHLELDSDTRYDLKGDVLFANE